MSTVIKVENLSKKYIIGHQKQDKYTALRDVMMHKIRGIGEKLRHPLSPNKEEITLEEFWALKDINLDIKQGDRVGIIGRNGAGKSTLLKILSRITEPTTGRIKIKGRVASLLEVGTGFHPELTGRENIFLNGAILGMSRADIKKNFDEIVAFAEVEKFLDTPVKRYSSGMYVRLAFAVAAHLKPEILIVDEVLAVGDAQFQKKCLGKMEDVGREGRTVLFVSHNMGAIQRLCNIGILLENGQIRKHSFVASVLEEYQNSLHLSQENIRDEQEVENTRRKAYFYEWNLIDSQTNLQHSSFSRDSCCFSFKLTSNVKIKHAVIGFAIWDSEGRLIFASSSKDNNEREIDIDIGVYYVFFKTKLPIKADNYQLDISIHNAEYGQLDRWNAYPKLSILPRSNTTLPDKWQGILNEESNFTITAKQVGNENIK